VAPAGFALFLDVHHFPTGRDLAVLADHAAASEGREAEKPNETHHRFVPPADNAEQHPYLIELRIPSHNFSPQTFRVPTNPGFFPLVAGLHDER
jgi:hypothetical protein